MCRLISLGVATMFLWVPFAIGCESSTNPSLGGSDLDSDSDTDTDSDTDGDSDGDTDSDSDTDTDTNDDSDTDDCSDESEYVYLVDIDRTFYKFSPLDKTFTSLGTLNCDAGSGLPFSMSVSRDDIAYVLYAVNYTDCVGLFPVNINDGTCGDQTDFQCYSGALELFGMGFATNGPDVEEETLHIGSIVGSSGETGSLGTLDTSTWNITSGGALVGDPEFTGTGEGELWGFFPNSTTPFIAQIDKDSAELIVQWPLVGLTNQANAWAFAHWGGSFYVFYKMFHDASTNIYKVTDGNVELFMSNTGKEIVGAGVSTCAPVAPPI